MTRELDPTTYDVLDHIARYRIGVDHGSGVVDDGVGHGRVELQQRRMQGAQLGHVGE